MLKTLLSASLVGIASLLAAVPAHALSFTWQFTADPTISSSSGVVKGTIDGLVIGSNSGAGITATVTDTPTGQLLGSYSFSNTLDGGDAFTVDAGGNVTFADARFDSANGLLLVGNVGNSGGFNPRLSDKNIFLLSWSNGTGQTTFSGPPTAVPFDFSPAPAVVILGGIFAAKKLRKKLVKQ
jgi:hypothetical protein